MPPHYPAGVLPSQGLLQDEQDAFTYSSVPHSQYYAGPPSLASHKTAGSGSKQGLSTSAGAVSGTLSKRARLAREGEGGEDMLNDIRLLKREKTINREVIKQLKMELLKMCRAIDLEIAS